MQKLFILLFGSIFSYSQQPAIPFEIFQMSTTITLIPTVFPTYATIEYFTPNFELKRKEKIEKFVDENFEFLKEEIAKGEGEHLDTLATLYDLKTKDEWKQYLQNHFNKIYKEEKNNKEVLDYINHITYQSFKNSKVYSVEEYNQIINTPIH